MALVSRVVSDISGTEANESEFVKLVVRQHPATDGDAKVLDVLPSEIADLKDAGDLVILEVNNGEKRQLVVKLNDFRKLVSDEIVASAPSNRGRRPGTRL